MSLLEGFWAAPPISRTIAAAAFTLSVLIYTGFVSGFYFVFRLSDLLKLPPQVWRIPTSFLITRPKLAILLDPYFLYTYGSKLELGSPKFPRPEDFFTYIVFVSLTIMGLNGLLTTGAMTFVSALVLAFAYTATQDMRGQKVSFFIASIPAEFVPYAMLLVTLVAEDYYAAKIQSTGLIAAHLHDFLTRLWPAFGGGRNLVPTPGFVRRMFQPKEAAVKVREYGTAFRPAPQTASASASGSSSAGVLPESWRNRGSGHRLGGD